MPRLELLPPDPSIGKPLRDSWTRLSRTMQRVGKETPELQIFANNAAALAAGLRVGDNYRTGTDPDLVCVVH